MVKQGIFITLSGIDASGKSTIQGWICNILRNYTDKEILLVDGLKPLVYTEILKEKATQYGEDMFDTFDDLCLLTYSLALIRKYLFVIEPALREGKIVITHRDDLCCKAYTMLRDKNKTVMPIIEKILSNYPEKDAHFYCDIDVETALKRIEIRKKGGYIPSINENRECLEQLKKNYEKLLLNNKKAIILNTKEITSKDIEKILLARLKGKV